MLALGALAFTLRGRLATVELIGGVKVSLVLAAYVALGH